MIDSIETSISDRRAGKAVKTPFAKIMPEGEEAETYIDVSLKLNPLRTPKLTIRPRMN